MYVYIVSSIFKKDDGNYKKYSIAYKTVELALEYVVADMETQYDGAYVDLMTDAIKQNVVMRGDYFFRYGGNDHYIMIEKMEVHGEQPNNVDNVIGFGLGSESAAESEANVQTENIVPEMSEEEVNVQTEENVNVETVPEMSEHTNNNVETEPNVENVSENIENAEIRPDIKSGDIVPEMFEAEAEAEAETETENNIIENAATPQPTSASLGSDVDSPLTPPAASLSKGGRTRKTRKNGTSTDQRKTKKRSQ